MRWALTRKTAQSSFTRQTGQTGFLTLVSILPLYFTRNKLVFGIAIIKKYHVHENRKGPKRQKTEQLFALDMKALTSQMKRLKLQGGVVTLLNALWDNVCDENVLRQTVELTLGTKWD